MDSRDFPLSSETKQIILRAYFNDGINLEEFPNIAESYYRKLVESSRAYSITKKHSEIANIVGLLK
jgi:hypothetical protein